MDSSAEPEAKELKSLANSETKGCHGDVTLECRDVAVSRLRA